VNEDRLVIARFGIINFILIMEVIGYPLLSNISSNHIQDTQRQGIMISLNIIPLLTYIKEV
jgi:hypothetical protein